jgi:hypothetical protein
MAQCSHVAERPCLADSSGGVVVGLKDGVNAARESGAAGTKLIVWEAGLPPSAPA